MKLFDALVQDILQDRWESSPVTATAEGIHDFDDRLDIYEPAYQIAMAARRKRFVQALNTIPDEELDLSRRIDKRVLESALTADVHHTEVLQPWRRDPGLYLKLGLNGMYLLVPRDFAPAVQRAHAAVRRAEAFPRLLHEGKRNIRVAPRILSELALQIADGARVFLREGLHPFLAPHVGARADAAVENALAAVDDYVGHLHGSWMERDNDFAIGCDAYVLKLSEEHLLPYDTRQLVEMGEEARRDAVTELEEIAGRIEPDVSWPDLLGRLKAQGQSSPDTLTETCRREMERARQFVLDHKLATIPREQSVDVTVTPPFMRPFQPLAALLPAAPFESRQKSLFYVTPADAAASGERVEHCLPELTMSAVHEAYPGHHLQFAVANRGSSAVRKVFGTSVMTEGWATYCEQMMQEAGYFPDHASHLFQVKNRLWRAIRVILDVRLHTGDMSLAAAVDYLVGEVHLERSTALAEVRGYCSTPTYAISSFIGMHGIFSLRRELQMRAHGGFSLGAFHDRLLRWGHIPLALTRDALLQDPAFKRAA